MGSRQASFEVNLRNMLPSRAFAHQSSGLGFSMVGRHEAVMLQDATFGMWHFCGQFIYCLFRRCRHCLHWLAVSACLNSGAVLAALLYIVMLHMVSQVKLHQKHEGLRLSTVFNNTSYTGTAKQQCGFCNCSRCQVQNAALGERVENRAAAWARMLPAIEYLSRTYRVLIEYLSSTSRQLRLPESIFGTSRRSCRHWQDRGAAASSDVKLSLSRDPRVSRRLGMEGMEGMS